MAAQPARTFGVGIIGLGAISRYWLPAIAKHPRARLAAACDIRPPQDPTLLGSAQFYPDHARGLPRNEAWTTPRWAVAPVELSFTVALTFVPSSLLAHPEVDIVVIDTPPSTHLTLVEAALRAGKKVAVEKPLATSLQDGQFCVFLAHQLKTPLYLAWHSAFGGAAVKQREVMKEFFDKGDTLESFSVDAHILVTRYHGGASWIFNPEVSGGGCLIDSAINALSIIIQSTGAIRPEKVSFYTPPGHKVESVVDATFVGIDNPALKGTLRFDWLRPGDEKGLYTFAFRSGVKVSFEIVSGQVTIVEANGEQRALAVKVRDEAHDATAIPMSLEYENVFNDAMDYFLNPPAQSAFVNPGGFRPFWTCMAMYEMAGNRK